MQQDSETFWAYYTYLLVFTYEYLRVNVDWENIGKYRLFIEVLIKIGLNNIITARNS